MQNADLPLLEQLSENSAPYRDPLAAIDWMRLDRQSWWLPEAALSLYGLPEYGEVPRDTRLRLSHYEFVNVMLCGLWLERAFLRRIAGRLAADLPRAQYEYFLHELREEAGHSLMFLQAIARSGLALPEGAWTVPSWIEWLMRYLPARGPLFWFSVVIAEDVPDRFNRFVRSQSQAVNPAIVQICTLHVVDEARHIAAARSRLEAALGTSRAPLLAAAPLVTLLLRRFADIFFLPPARFYELAGLTHGASWRRLAARNPVHRRFITQCLAPTLRMLESYGLKPRL